VYCIFAYWNLFELIGTCVLNCVIAETNVPGHVAAPAAPAAGGLSAVPPSTSGAFACREFLAYI
jgi:hypothetical protein